MEGAPVWASTRSPGRWWDNAAGRWIVRTPVCVTGAPGKPELEACWELGALVAAEVAG